MPAGAPSLPSVPLFPYSLEHVFELGDSGVLGADQVVERCDALLRRVERDLHHGAVVAGFRELLLDLELRRDREVVEAGQFFNVNVAMGLGAGACVDVRQTYR